MGTIPLTRGLVTILDDEDFERLSGFRWYPVKGRLGKFYAGRVCRLIDGAGAKRRFGRQMQRDIMDPDMLIPGSKRVDHRNGDTLDNRRENLRWADHSLSNINRRMPKSNASGYRGVWLEVGKGLWRARLKVSGRIVEGGHHGTAEAAALAYNALAIKHHGADARLNVIPGASDV